MTKIGIIGPMSKSPRVTLSSTAWPKATGKSRPTIPGSVHPGLVPRRFPEGDKRRYGYSRDRRSDCVQVVIALVVTPEGLPLAYEVLPGNTSDKTTLRGFLDRIERQYGKARRIWVMDRGIPTEAVLEEMRGADPAVSYLVGTPKGRLSRLEQQLLAKPWHEARPGVRRPRKAKHSQPSRCGIFLLTPDQHRTVAKDLRRQVNDPKAQDWRPPTKSWRWRYRSTSTNKCRRSRRNSGELSKS
jgi:hypothetical protein